MLTDYTLHVNMERTENKQGEGQVAKVEILKKKAPPPPHAPPSLKARLMAEFQRLLPADAFAFAMPDEGGIPGILIVHRGRALGLEPGRPGRNLTERQRAMFARLREAGMRIEVARSHGEALAQLREMGVALDAETSLTRQVAELFRAAQKERRA